MIQLQVDFTLLNKFFGVSTAKIPQYANKDFKEIMELEAAQGNTKAEDYKKILRDPEKLLEIFKLSNVENKFVILQNMNEADLDNLLPYLTQDQLAMGLNFFTDEKLMTMAEQLPIETLCAMIFEKFTLNDVMAFMDDASMNTFLMQPDVEKKYSMSYFESLDAQDLTNLMTKAFGADFEQKSQKENLEYLSSLTDNQYNHFIQSIEREEKIKLINGITSQEPDLIYLFEAQDIVAPMNMLMKEDKVKLMGTLDPEFLIPMIQELPVDLTAIVLTQIDPKDFSEILAEDFQDILSSVVLFSNKAA